MERNQERENSSLYVQLPKMSVFEKTSGVYDASGPDRFLPTPKASAELSLLR